MATAEIQPVVTDGVTILGDGTSSHPLHSGDVAVTVDGVSILGNGTLGDPLHQDPGPIIQEFRAGVLLAINAAVGAPVQVAQVNAHLGITTVQPSSAIDPNNFNNNGRVNGVIRAINGDGTVQVQTAGLLPLTTGQWDLITGGSGGLTLGTTYYLAQFPAIGRMVDEASIVPGQLRTRVGVGLSPTTLLLQPSQTVQNLAELTFQTGFAITLGQAAFVTAPDTILRAVSDVTLLQALAACVESGFFNGTAVMQVGGKVVLTPVQWAVVTDTGGLVAGTTYYVDTSAHPGRLTSVEPVSGFAAQVGVALSTTTLVLSTPVVPRVL